MVPQSLLLQVAKRASVLKRRKSRNKMEQQQQQERNQDGEGDVVFYMEEPRAATPNR